MLTCLASACSPPTSLYTCTSVHLYTCRRQSPRRDLPTQISRSCSRAFPLALAPNVPSNLRPPIHYKMRVPPAATPPQTRFAIYPSFTQHTPTQPIPSPFQMTTSPTAFVASGAPALLRLGKPTTSTACTASTTSLFVGRSCGAAPQPRRSAATIRMQDDYKIEQSEFVDADSSDDDGGDGFVGESDMDDHLGLAMPEDLASFEKRELQDTQSREELVEKLRDIRDRRRDVMVDRRRGIGMDNANEYLKNL